MRKNSSFAKGLTTGMAVGAAAIAVGSALIKSSKPVKRTKKKMGDMLDTVSSVCDNLSCMMK